MASTEYYVFEWREGGRGQRLGSLIAPDRHTAWEAARRMYETSAVHVQTRADYEAEMRAIAPSGAA